MNHALRRTVALAGAGILFVCGFIWYLSTGVWSLSVQTGFQALAANEEISAAYSTVVGPHTLEFDLSQPRSLVGKTLYQGDNGTITVSRVEHVSDTSLRIWFQATGKLHRDGRGELVSVCLPQGNNTLRSSPVAQPAEIWSACLSTYDTAFRERGNQFAVTVVCLEEPKDLTGTLHFQTLQRVTFTPDP